MKQKILLLLSLSLFLVIGLTAQTHYPIYNPNYNYAAHADTSPYEKLLMKWKAGVNAVQQQVNASNVDFEAFSTYYQSSIDSERYEFSQKAKAGKITRANIASYIRGKQKKFTAMYANFINLRNTQQLNQPLNGHPLVPLTYNPPTCNAACTNMDFSSGDLSGWYGYYSQNNSSAVAYNFTGLTGGYLGAVQKGAADPTTRTYQIHLTSAAANDWFLNNYHAIHMSQGSPWGSGYSVMLGDSTMNGAQIATLTQEFEVTAATNSMTYAYAVILDNPPYSHTYWQQPFFSVTLFDSAGDTIKNCGEYFVSSGPGLPGFVGEWDPIEGDSAYWRNWTQVNIPLGSYVGQCVTIQFQVGDCSEGGHFGYAYVDASCEDLVVTASSPSGALCGNGGTIDLYGPNGESAYHWYGPPNSILTNDTLQNITADSLGTYTLVITPSTGELCKDTLYFNVNSVDTIKASASILSPINCSAGTGSAMTVARNGIPPYTYDWASVHQSTDTATGLSAGSYTVSVTDSNGCSATASVTLTEPPALLATTTYTTATCGYNNGDAAVSVSGGNPAYTYLWMPGSNTNALATGLAAGSYTITVTDHSGCTATASITMAQGFLTATMGTITDVSCNGGNNGTATVNASGGASPYTYSWSPRGGNGATGTGLAAGTYTVTVRDLSGCSLTITALITQPTAITENITVLSTPPCNGGVGSASVSASGGTSAYTYLWTPSNQTTTTATGLAAGAYTAKITDAHGCTSTLSVTITQPNTLTVSISLANICNPGNASATASPTGGTGPYTYSWSPSNQTTATATGVSAGTYTVSVTDKNHCTASATIVQPTAVTAAIAAHTNVLCFGYSDGSATSLAGGGVGPYTYLWTPSNQNTAVANNIPAANYTIKITDTHGCTATASVSITQPVAMTASVTGPTIRCLGDSGTYTTNVTGGTGPYNYTWAPASGVSNVNSGNPTITPPGTITYTVTVTDVHGCIAYGYLSFSFPPPLGVSIDGASVTCSGRFATLCALPTGGTGGDTYLWEPVNMVASCITLPVNTTTDYTLTVTDNCGVSAKANTTIHVIPPPAVVFTSNTIQGCTPLCIQFNNLTPAIGTKEEYIWNFGDGDSLVIQNPIYCYNKSGQFDVTLTVITDSGCSSTLTKTGMITVNSSPKAAFTYSPQPVSILSPTVEFMNQSSDEYGIAYQWWNFGDGSDSATTVSNPTHTYKDTGTYCAQLIEMNNRGCSDTATNCLVVQPLYNLYIPSAFTPNGDGLNETFQPKGDYIKSFDMYIFDRWGSELYHTTNINDGWNGSVHGVGPVCQEDTYIYKITVTDAEGNQHSYVGDVTLLK